MKHELTWWKEADQGCTCGLWPCPVLEFRWRRRCIRADIAGLRHAFIPMLRIRWAVRGDGERE